ncbi:MAG: hypothetical protein GC138_01325 [Gammaproteobacteria bacterium]|nr:hypothetical protein [Gammaproteobacteria bacterium]
MAFDWCVTSSTEMNIVDRTLSKEANHAMFDRRIADAMDDIGRHFELNQPAGSALPIAKRTTCARASDAEVPDLSLVIDLSGYGTIKEKWKTLLIGTGVVEGVFQGILVGTATQNPWLGFGVAAEEMTSEYLTWNGVDWLLGETYAPVTLEGRLTYRGRTIWEDSYFVTENEDELAPADRKNKSKQLVASLHKAESELMAGLSAYLEREVIRPGEKGAPNSPGK